MALGLGVVGDRLDAVDEDGVVAGRLLDPPPLAAGEVLDDVVRTDLESLGVVPNQVMSIAHPNMKSISAWGDAIQVREVYYPTVPQTREDAERVKLAAYQTKGIRGIYVSEDDTAALVHAGFWEEELDYDYLDARMNELRAKIGDENHTVYVTGFPWLYTSVQRYVPEVQQVFVVTTAALAFLLWNYFRTWTGVWVPIFSGLLSSVWALGLVPLLGLSLDPLVLVVPMFLSARALSHSVQSMDRYHEEYFELKDRDTAIVKSYIEIFPPAMVAIAADSLATLTLLVARIPLIQNLAILCSFWIASIFVSVVTLHPIILSFTPPPEHRTERGTVLERFAGWMILAAIALILDLYGMLPGNVPLVLTGIAITGALVHLATGIALPIYAQVGDLVTLINDLMGRFFAAVYVQIERFLVWISCGWRRGAMAVCLGVLLAVGVYYQQKVRIGDATAARLQAEILAHV